MLRIAICDDEGEERERTAALLRAYGKAHPDLAGRSSLFSSAAELLNEIEESGGFDLYILDVIMPERNGIELGRLLRERKEDGAILYLTTSADYAVESYDTGAFFYLLKPVEQGRFFEVLDRAAAARRKRREEGVTVQTHDALVRIPYDSILCVELAERAMRYHLADGDAVVSRTLREPFVTAAQPLLNDGRFRLYGSSFVLNLQRVRGVSRTQALFSTGASMPLPRTQQKKIKQEWMEYWLREGGL